MHHIRLVHARRGAVVTVALVALGVAGVMNLQEKAGAATTVTTLYPSTTIPATVTTNDAKAVELGVQFHTSTAGTITGIRFYKSTSNTGSHVGSLWNSKGALLASATFSSETASGWQTATFSAPVSIKANTTYTASYHTNVGYYSSRNNTFANGATIGNPAIIGTKGTYKYATGSTYPTSSWQYSEYYVDAMFASATATPATSSSSPVSSPTSSTPVVPSSTTTTTSVPTSSAPTSSAPSSSTPTSSAPSSSTATPTPTVSTSSSTSSAVPSSSAPSSSATPTPTPSTSTSGSPGPLTQPPAAGVPAGTALTTYSGPSNITTAGTVINGADIPFAITISAANVTITNSNVHGTGMFGVTVKSGSLNLSHTTISGFQNGFAGDNMNAYMVDLKGLLDDGFKIGSNSTYDGIWCHALTPEAGAHSDCGQLEGGETNVVIKNSWLDGSAGGSGATSVNSALIIKPDFGPTTAGPVTIDNNVLGSGNYTLFVVPGTGTGGPYYITGVNVTNNRFLRNAQYGPVDVTMAPATWSNNAWNDTGVAITP